MKLFFYWIPFLKCISISHSFKEPNITLIKLIYFLKWKNLFIYTQQWRQTLPRTWNCDLQIQTNFEVIVYTVSEKNCTSYSSYITYWDTLPDFKSVLRSLFTQLWLDDYGLIIFRTQLLGCSLETCPRTLKHTLFKDTFYFWRKPSHLPTVFIPYYYYSCKIGRRP